MVLHITRASKRLIAQSLGPPPLRNSTRPKSGLLFPGLSQMLAPTASRPITTFSPPRSRGHFGRTPCRTIKPSHRTAPEQVSDRALVFVAVKAPPYISTFSRGRADRSKLGCYSRNRSNAQGATSSDYSAPVSSDVLPSPGRSLGISIDGHVRAAVPMRFRGAATAVRHSGMSLYGDETTRAVRWVYPPLIANVCGHSHNTAITAPG
jgi:hypothetical protein